MRKFIINVLTMTFFFLSVVIIVNVSIDSSEVISHGDYNEMARLSLSGNIIVTPLNYNERLYQVYVVNEMKELPETIVIGCSRGMFLGEEITGYTNLYNNCVSGACMEDYCALLGLYDKKFGKLPKRIIIETSPWIFYEDNPEARWQEQQSYLTLAKDMYYKINGKPLIDKGLNKTENPYLSIPYFRYNLNRLLRNGKNVFLRETAKIWTNETEHLEYSDGSVGASLEGKIEERLKAVRATRGSVIYQNVYLMKEIESGKRQEYENLLEFLQSYGIEVLIYMQPFSVTQCHYSYDEGMNSVFVDVESYLRTLGAQLGITVIGGFDARKYGLKDENFTDFMHLDKTGTKIV